MSFRDDMLSYRNLRLHELHELIGKPEFKTLMDNFVSFLMDDLRDDKISLRITTGESSYTDGKTVTLGMPRFFFDDEFSELEWTGLFKGFLAHEVQHINSSNFSDIEDIIEKYQKMMTGRGLSDSLLGNIAQNLLNIMEDGRIENIIIHKLPGLRLPLIMLNQGIRNYNRIENEDDNTDKEFKDFISNCLSYSKTGRLAIGISHYAGTRFEQEFKRVQPLFDQAIDAYSSEDCKNCCLKMLESTADYFTELLTSMRDQQKYENASQPEYTSDSTQEEYNKTSNNTIPNSESDKSTSKQSKGKQDQGSEENSKPGDDQPGGSQESGEGKNKDSSEEEYSNSHGDQESESEKKGTESVNSGKRARENALRKSGETVEDWTADFSGDGAEEYSSGLSKEELETLRRNIKQALGNGSKNSNGIISSSAPKASARKKLEEHYANERVRKYGEIFPILKQDKLPANLEQIARQLEQKFERVLRQKRQEQRNMRKGVINSRALYRTGMNDSRIFMRKGEPLNADLAAFILLDNSGSMKDTMGSCNNYKFEQARIAAGIIERALMKFAAFKISLFDVSGGIIRHATLKKFDEKTNGGRCYSSIMAFGTGGGNKDGYSIRVATNELLARKESKKLLVVLSDGLPSDYSGGIDAGVEDVKSAVRDARRKGIIVIPIMFSSDFEKEIMKDYFDEMYRTYISCDIENIIPSFQRLFTEIIKKS